MKTQAAKIGIAFKYFKPTQKQPFYLLLHINIKNIYIIYIFKKFKTLRGKFFLIHILAYKELECTYTFISIL